MHEFKVSRKYFNRLFTAFLFTSIIPLIICVAAIIYVNYQVMISEQNKRLLSINDATVNRLEYLLDEYENILNIISEDTQVRDVLIENNRSNGLENIMESALTGRKTNMEIHVIDYDSPISKSTNIRPSLYDQSIYFDWGILYEARSNPNKVVLFPSNYTTENGQIILSLGKGIVDSQGEFIGYAIIDVYEKTIVDQISFAGDESEYILLLNDSIVVLDTTSTYKGGFSTFLSDKDKMEILQSSLVDSDRSETIFGVKNKDQLEYSLYTFIKVDNFYKETLLLIKISLVIAILIFIICFLMVRIQVRKLYIPINVVVDAMKEITEGNLEVRIQEYSSNDEMSIVANGFNRMLDKIENLLNKVIEETERKKDAEIKLLQAQISPHFLYNMLNEIKSLAKLGRTQEVSTFVVSLGKLLRHSISNQEKFISIREELVFLNDYLQLQKIRYENSFDSIIEIDEGIMNCKIPNLILQPIIENSIIHGFRSEDSKPTLKLKGYRRGDMVFIEIHDNGDGVEDEFINYINNTEESSTLYGGHGLENIQKRLLLIYGSKYGLRIQSEIGKYTKVIVIIPYRDN